MGEKANEMTQRRNVKPKWKKKSVGRSLLTKSKNSAVNFKVGLHNFALFEMKCYVSLAWIYLFFLCSRESVVQHLVQLLN